MDWAPSPRWWVPGCPGKADAWLFVEEVPDRYLVASGSHRLSPFSLAESQQLQFLKANFRRLVSAQRVVVAVTVRGLVCVWWDRKCWRWVPGYWPVESLRDGIPHERESMGELLADLLLEMNVAGANVELLLPLPGVHWRVMEGLPPGELDQARRAVVDLPWPLVFEESYTAVMPFDPFIVAVGVSRQYLQAWIDVVEIADLPLIHTGWILTSALRGLLKLTLDWQGDIAWVIEEAESVLRLVILRRGIPEIDRLIEPSLEPIKEVRRCLLAWKQSQKKELPLGWWLCVPFDHVSTWDSAVDHDGGEQCLNVPIPSGLQTADLTNGSEYLDPLIHLALFGELEGVG